MNHVTEAIVVGPFASSDRAPKLRAAGVTHILNVSDIASVLDAETGSFREVAWYSIEDLTIIPTEVAIACLDTLDRMVCEANARVYVHCVAGWNRSPTIIWLYLVACGLPEDDAKWIIEARARDAVPGHPKLIDAALVDAVRRHGREAFLPHRRPAALERPPA